MSSLFDKLKRNANEHTYLGRMELGQVLGENTYKLNPVIAHENYFELRIPETFLHLKREYWKDYAPLTVIMLRFLHDGIVREIPFVISSQTMLSSFSGDTLAWSEFYNIRALGPFPYEGDDVELAIGLYAVETKDYAGEMFALADKLMHTLQAPLASQAFETADTIKGIIDKLTGLDKVKRKLGFYQAFSEHEGSPDQFRDQYLLQINAGEQQFEKKKLRIQNGRLHVDVGSNELQRFDENDFCLTRILALDKTPVSQLPFWKTWQKVRRLVSEGNRHMSHSIYSELLRQITMCTDLTEKDRRNMPFVFKANYEEEIERFSALHDGGVGTLNSEVKYRTAGSGIATGAAGLERSANNLRGESFPSQIYQGLKQLSDEWDNIPALGEPEKDNSISSELLGQQLDQIRRLVHTEDIKPSIIADALTFY